MKPAQTRRRKILVSAGLFHIFHDSIADGLAVLLPYWRTAFQLSLTQVGFVVADFVSASHVPRAFSLFYTAIIVGAALSPPVFGWISDAAGVGVTVICAGLAALGTLPLACILSKAITAKQSAVD